MQELPGQLYGHRIEAKTIAESWVKVVHQIKTIGKVVPVGDNKHIKTLINLMAVINNEPDEFYIPTPNYLPINRETIINHIAHVLKDAPYIEGRKHTYGQRLRSWFGRDQVEDIINKLIKEIDAASAVINLWDAGANLKRRPDNSSDYDHSDNAPSLNHIWVRVINETLSLTAIFNSHDIFGAWVQDAIGLRALQKHIKDEIEKRSEYKLNMGALITISQSAYIYGKDWQSVDSLINEQYERIWKEQDYYDPSGNFLIEIMNGEITVTQTTPGSGETVTCYSGNNPLKLIKEICAASPVIHADHAAYLGIELQKAAKCLEVGKEYIQDR